MLDSHPTLAIPPETGFLALQEFTGQGNDLREQFFSAVTNYPPDAPNWPDFQISEDLFRATLAEIEHFSIDEGYRAFYRLYASRFNKSRWGDKTPLYCMHMEQIAAVLPEVRFIHIVRDGRDVALSLREMWFSPGWEIETQAAHWSRCILFARQQGARCRHYIEVHYEDMVLHPRETLAKVCAFLELEYDEAMLRYHERTADRLKEHQGRSLPEGKVLTQEQRLRQQKRTTEPLNRNRVFAWKREMSADERARFEQVAGKLLAELGY